MIDSASTRSTLLSTGSVSEASAAPVIATYARKLLTHRMLHCERTLANTLLGTDGVKSVAGDRGRPPALYRS